MAAVDPETRILRFLHRKASASSSDLAGQLGVSRQAAHRRLAAMALRGVVISQGAGRGSRWVLPAAARLDVELATEGLEEDRIWSDVQKLPAIASLSPAARSIASYAFTEMLNNVIDHARSPIVRVTVDHDDASITVGIADRGVGAYARIQAALGLASPLEALEELTKGKVTTMPERHTGEGVFFTSKAVDRFELTANGISWIVDNRRGDFTAAGAVEEPGTRVTMRIGRDPIRALADVFAEYTDDFELMRTRAVVRLFALGIEFVSRSEAKRVVRGLSRFREVVLDFEGVASIGQGFADEVFRVFARAHPEVQMTPVAMVPAVAFMVRRALGRA